MYISLWLWPEIQSSLLEILILIHFHIKSKSVQGLVFVQITFEKYTTNFYFENSEVGIKTAMANLQPLLTWNLSAYLNIFMLHRFQ